MTAIFAFAGQEYVALAADSLRRDPLGIFTDQQVRKAYAWGNSVLFAHAGNGPPLGRLAQAILAEFPNSTPDFRGFTQAFEKHRPTELAAALARNTLGSRAERLIQGTFVVAMAGTSTGERASISFWDFKTGIRSVASYAFAGAGSDPLAFTAVAAARAGQATAAEVLACDEWAGLCIADAIATKPQDVDWPMTLLAIGPTGIIEQKFAHPPLKCDPRFALPSRREVRPPPIGEDAS